MDSKKRIVIANELANQGDYIRALALCDEPLEENPNHIGWLCLVVYCLEKANKLAIAYHLCRRLMELAPRDIGAILNMVNLEARLWMTTAAIKTGKRGLMLADNDLDRLKLLLNLGCVYVDTGRFKEGEKYLLEAAEIDPSHEKIWSNLGFCTLAQRRWKEGWEQMHKQLGLGWRQKVTYFEEPEWDGTPGHTVAVYGEQGVGDQICAASAVPDAEKHIDIILDTHPKLKNLFARSFPNVTVNGVNGVTIDKVKFDCSAPIFQLCETYRHTDESFPCEPFLVADEDRTMMWKSLWKSKGKPVIGIGWTGGIQRTGRRFRCATLEDWLPMFESIDAHWVSLEYKESTEVEEFKKAHPEIDIKEYPHATLTEDYDDTAALVASLDCVVTVPTSVGHLAGALGVPIVWMKHCYPCWKVQAGMPFHPVTEWVEWGGTWTSTVKSAIPAVQSILGTTTDSRSHITSCDTASSLEHQSPSASTGFS